MSLLQSIEYLTNVADPLADAVVADYHRSDHRVRGLLQQGIRHGVCVLTDAPKSFIALISDAQQAISAMSTDRITRATSPYLWIGPLWLSISLGPGSLVRTYQDPNIAAVLVRTGRLLPETVARRLLETQLWSTSIIKPGGLQFGELGLVNTLEVRLLHAHVRANLQKNGWRDANGKRATPIDQVQMIRTWLDFTVVSFCALERMGLELSDKERSELYGVWRIVGRLLGIDAEFLNKISDDKQARELVREMDAAQPSPNENARTLTQAMIIALGSRISPMLNLPVDVSNLLVASLCRFFHGDETADCLGIEKNWTQSLLPIMADANRYRLERVKSDAAYREQLQRSSLDTFDKIEQALSDTTQYQAIFAS